MAFSFRSKLARRAKTRLTQSKPALRKGGLIVVGAIVLLANWLFKWFKQGLISARYELERQRDEKALSMGRRREWRGNDAKDYDIRDDEDRQTYSRQMSEARRRYELEIRAARDIQREQRKAASRGQAAWRWAGVGAGIFLGSVIGDALNGPAGIGFGIMVGGLIWWIGSLVNNAAQSKALKTGAIAVPRRPEIAAPTVAENALPSGRTELVQQLLGEAATALRQLDAIMPRLKHPDSVSSVARIVAVGNRIMQNVGAQPENLAIAQRLFTYYCPESVKVAEALAKLESSPNPDVDRISGSQTVLKKLEVLFDRTELELKAGEGKELDIDLRLLDQSIEADLKTR